MRIIILLISSAVIFITAGCASTNFQQYEGRSNSNIVEGTGGTKESIEEYELWGIGTPPRKYEILGMAEIEDFDNFLGRERIRKALIAKIKEQKGSAAIVIDASVGGQSMGFAIGSGGSITPAIGFGKKINRYLIVKYLSN